MDHIPVMLAEVVDLLAPALGGDDPVLVDGTVGLGGHAAALLRACPEARLIGLDRDPQALAAAARRLAPFADRVTLVEAVYDELPQVLARLGQTRVQGVLLDLGISSLQIDDPDRGFAYAYDAPLDMRMGRQSLTAAQVVNTYSRADLARILRTYGEERFADRIARRIVAERDREPFVTSGRLVRLLTDAVPRASQRSGGHPAKRTFQALRIEVNGELAALEAVLPSAVAALAIGGRIAVLAYHSLEDRLVKQVLAAGARDLAPRDLPVVPAGLGPGAAAADPGRPAPAACRGGDQPQGGLGPAAGRRSGSANGSAHERPVGRAGPQWRPAGEPGCARWLPPPSGSPAFRSCWC